MKQYSPPLMTHNFGGLPKELIDFKKSKVVVFSKQSFIVNIEPEKCMKP